MCAIWSRYMLKRAQSYENIALDEPCNRRPDDLDSVEMYGGAHGKSNDSLRTDSLKKEMFDMDTMRTETIKSSVDGTGIKNGTASKWYPAYKGTLPY